MSRPLSAAPPTIATQVSSDRERRTAFAVVAALCAASLIALPFRRAAYPVVASFIPAFAATTGLADFLTATLLFSLYRVEGSRAILAVAAAYLLDAFFVVPYALTFPGVVGANGFVGNVQSAAWLWLAWHASFPLLVLAGTAFGEPGESGARAERRGRYVLRTVLAVAAVTVVAATVVTAGRDELPELVRGQRFSLLFTGLTVAASLANLFAASVLSMRTRPAPAMNLWVMVALTASALDLALNGLAPSRFSLVWYVGKVETFVTATVVLVSLLAAWSTMYARTVALTRRLLQSTAERQSLESRLARERQISTMLQEASLTRTLPASKRFRFDAAYHPGSDEATIGGDWYDAFELADGRIAITIGDVMGSGIGAAVAMTKLRHAMQAAAMIDPRPAAMLDVADRTLQLHDAAGYATALAMIYDPAAESACFSSAGHLGPLVRDADGTVGEETSFGTLLGLGMPVARDTRTVPLPPGSTLVLYTDGIVELKRDLVDGQRRLAAALSGAGWFGAAHPAQALVEEILGGSQALDDIALLLLHVAGSLDRPAATDPVLSGPAASVLRDD